MKHSITVGFSFGLTSAIITTLGLIVGLNASTHSKLAVIGGIITIAVADAMSDALGIHISEESEGTHSTKEIWVATLSTFFTKFVFAISFIGPVLLLPLGPAIIVCIVWGLVLLGLFSWILGKTQNKTPWHVVTEHLVIAGIVIIITHFLGASIATQFGTPAL
ncbi:hypothetical protein ACFLRA_00515 [Bdellovibrionota bacterium]